MREDSPKTAYYPIFLDVKEKRCVVVGGGTVALRKVSGLLEHGAHVVVISPACCPELEGLARDSKINIMTREYQAGDINDSFLVIAATDSDKVNHFIAEEARRRHIIINVVDDPDYSDFILPSCLRRGALTIAISTAGNSPALARKIRTKLEQEFGEEYTSLVDLIGEVRTELKKRATIFSSEDWQDALDIDTMITYIRNGQRERAKKLLLDTLGKKRG